MISRNVSEEDLFILVSARKGAASYLRKLDDLPVKLEKYFATNSRLVIYPQSYNENISYQQYSDFSAEPLNKGIEAVQKIGKGIGSIFNKPDKE